MKFSLEWMRDYVDSGLGGPEIGSRLTAVGFPMDSLEPFGDDTVLDFDVTTNRPDCMNHYGLARELAALTEKELKEVPSEAREEKGPTAKDQAAIAIEARELCARYTARLIMGVKVGPSPEWLAQRLLRIGLRPINAIVDATNFVLWELGHPLHAFDLNRLSDRRIIVRRARAGEPFTTLDGIARQLDPEMLVIADARRPVALAGVMGGLVSEISPSTTDVLLESAHFDPIAVRRTARKLGLHTDASHRFERGADLEITVKAADRCASLIVELVGGRISAGVLDCRTTAPFHREITLRLGRVDHLLGVRVPEAKMKGILQRLGCRVETADISRWRVATPSFRGDLSLEEDLIEEIARHHGYDWIPSTLPRTFVVPEGRPKPEKRRRRVREALIRAGFAEAINLSIGSGAENESLSGCGAGLQVTNPLAENQAHLRTTLLPGLLRNLVHNLNHGAFDVRLFEIGIVFKPPPRKGALPNEKNTLGLVAAGKGSSQHWSRPPEPPDLFDLKGAVDTVAKVLGLPACQYQPASVPFLVEGTGAEVWMAGEPAGFLGEVDSPAASAFGLEEGALVAEVSLEKLLAPLERGDTIRHRGLSRTPSVSRDLSFILDEQHRYSEIEEVIRSVDGAPITLVSLIDRYHGQPVPVGKVSMTINLLFQDPHRTLVSGEVANTLDRIIERLRDRLGAVLRGN